MKEGRLYIGLMSGTSLDGVDAALVRLIVEEKLKHELIHFCNIPFPMKLKKRVEEAMQPDVAGADVLCSLNFELGELFANAALQLMKESGISATQIQAIGSHGQTMHHIPKRTKKLHASTLQLGESSVIAYRTGCKVVSDFRSADMAAGGQGAPLVPYAEYQLFHSKEISRAFINIGGISNVTIMPKNCTLDEVYAFDMGPGNMIINALTRHFYQQEYDRGGAYASSGIVQENILNCMKDNPFFQENIPKTTGREMFGNEYAKQMLASFSNVSANDWIATATEFTAIIIAEQMKRFVLPNTKVDEVIVSGGGCYNQTLMQRITQWLNPIRVLTGEEFGINADAKEAVAFAVLADACIRGICANVPKATGADKHVILGSITRC